MQHVLVRKPVYPNDFRTLFQTLARLAVATSCAAGCASEGSSPNAQPEDHPAEGNQANAQPTGDAAWAPVGADAGASPDAHDAGWVPLACSENGGWPFEPAKLAMPMDSLTLYATLTPAQERIRGGPLGPPTFYSRDLYGVPCERASDKAACTHAIDQQVAATKCDSIPCTTFALVTRGDSVMRIDQGSDITALFGKIDTEVEAAAVALLADGSASCWFDHTSNGPIPPHGTHIRAVDDGYEVESLGNCYGAASTGTTMVSLDGSAKVLSNVAYCIGRRPEGLAPLAPCAARTELGAHFASVTQLEAASVFAFEQLARDLTRLGAPDELVSLARSAAREEVEHARIMGKLALRFGAELAPPHITPAAPREVLAIALENAVEGCVRETYGALLAGYQAETARDPEVRAAMQQVFEDETRHAQLAWQIAQWLEPRLTEAERETLQRARSAAYAELRGELDASLSHAARLQLGLPEVRVRVGLLAQLDAALNLQAA